MLDPLHPTLMTRVRARFAGERDTVLLEALRVAGRAAYQELYAAEQRRDELALDGTALWDAPVAVGSQLLAAWNGFVLQTLGESFVDADYAARPGTVGYVPEVTFTQAVSWLSAVEGWLSRTRQARSNPDYDISREMDLPADLPEWARVSPCPPEHLTALLAAVPPVREHVDVALYTLERAGVPEKHRAAVNRLHQIAAEAGAAADYALSLRTERHHPTLHERVENNMKHALELWFQVGQMAAMPRLVETYKPARPTAPKDTARLPGGALFDPWVLTDRASLKRWQHDRKAKRAIAEMWQFDPDPAATLALKAEVDRAVQAGDIDNLVVSGGGTCYFECPWSSLYQVRRPVRIGHRALRAKQQFTLRITADDVPRGGRFQREVVVGPFEPTKEVDYCDPDGRH